MCFISVCSPGDHLKTAVPGRPHGSFLIVVLFLTELAVMFGTCPHSWSPDCPQTQQKPSASLSLFISIHKDYYNNPYMIYVALRQCFSLAVEEDMFTWECHGVCVWVIVSEQWKNIMRTSTPHKAIPLVTPAARGVCV